MKAKYILLAVLFTSLFCPVLAAEQAQFRIDPEREPQNRFRLNPEKSGLRTQEEQLLRALDELKASDQNLGRKIEALEKDLKSIREAIDKVEFELKKIRMDMMS